MTARSVPRKMRGKGYRDVDLQILRWRKARIKAGRRANGKPNDKTRKDEVNAEREQTGDSVLRNIFSFDDE